MRLTQKQKLERFDRLESELHYWQLYAYDIANKAEPVEVESRDPKIGEQWKAQAYRVTGGNPFVVIFRRTYPTTESKWNVDIFNLDVWMHQIQDLPSTEHTLVIKTLAERLQLAVNRVHQAEHVRLCGF